MIKNLPQQWLLECPYEEIELSDFQLSYPDSPDYLLDFRFGPSLFDTSGRRVRKVDVEELDNIACTSSDWGNFIAYVRKNKIDMLVLDVHQKSFRNKIVEAYLFLILKAYVWHLKKAKINCKVQVDAS